VNKRIDIAGVYRLFVAALLLLVAGSPALAATPPVHRLAIQVSTSDAQTMNLVLNNAANVSTYYTGLGQQVQIEIVAFGPGLKMLREDSSPVKARLKSFGESMPNVRFDACNNTLQAMEKAEGKTIQLVPEAHIVPAGVVRLMTLEEEGWSYLRP